jgi:uncharacterized protein (TIGR04255 family)
MPWTPANPDHAIDRALIKFEFESLPTKALQRVTDIVQAASAASGFADVVNIQTPNVQILAGPDGVPQVVQDLKPSTVKSFRNLAADGDPIYLATCANDNLAFDVRKYSSWNEIFPLIRSCFEEAIRHINDNVSSIASVRFEYWDRFVRAEVDGDQFVRRDTQLAPGIISQLAGSWHSHVGFFKFKDDKRILLNANVDLMEAADVKNSNQPHLIPDGVNSLCRIHTSCVISPEGTAAFKDVNDCIDSADLAHTELKAVLGNIINQQLADQIKLAAKGFEL